MSKLQTLLQFWQSFNLPQVQQGLDLEVTEITSRQDESDNSRKQLIELIRDFKKDNSEEVRTSVGPLVKAFQNEIDALSKRSKAAEKAYFDIYKQVTEIVRNVFDLVDVIDPTPILEAAQERLSKQSSKIQDYEIEVQQLRETLADYNVQVADLRGKEKKLGELQNMINQYDKNIDETLNGRLKEAKDKLQNEFEERMRAVEDEKLLTERRLADQEVKLKASQRQLETLQTELFDISSKATERHEAKSDEVEILVNDLEVCQQRAVLAEKENEALRDQIQNLESSLSRVDNNWKEDVSTDIAKLEDLKGQLIYKESEVIQLQGKIQETLVEKSKDEEAFQTRLNKITTEKDELERQTLVLRQKLESLSDYDSIKKDLSIFKALEFSSEEQEIDSEKPMEVLILERSKALQADNTNLRLERDRLAFDLNRTVQELEERNILSERQANLIVELEEHVEKLQEMSNVNRGEAEGRSSTDFLVAELDLGIEPETPPRLLSRSSLSPPNLGTLDNNQKPHEAASLLTIVQAQRERFRKRNVELEEEHNCLAAQITSLQSEVSDLRSDNVKLYEKIRFLQGVQSRGQVSVTIPIESKYKQHYEKKLDPFTNFSNQERQRKISQLNIVEKIILSMVQFMLSNKSARIFIFIYSLLLHGLVFLVLMNQALSESHRRDLASSAEWQQKYLDHMNQEHNHG